MNPLTPLRRSNAAAGQADCILYDELLRTGGNGKQVPDGLNGLQRPSEQQ
ncbi:hypothetical protein [Neisseria sp. 19428wB4_WF04]|nr:hypothetical protein [Neisseria sp. 19428wB4_WF04]MBF0804516.1 hypothetical protein [Neisseria sp. 19428wB4_WF04]